MRRSPSRALRLPVIAALSAVLLAWPAAALGARTLYVPHSTSGVVAMHGLTVATGALNLLGTPTIPSGADTRRLALTPDGAHAYAANAGDDTVSMYSVAPATGALTAKSPATAAAGDEPAVIAVAPDGDHLYVANSAAGTVSQYAVDGDGLLSPLAPATIAAGTVPLGLAITPNGGSLYVAGSGDANVRMYTIAGDGTLSAKTPATVAADVGVSSLIITPNGTSAYAANTGADSISQYDVDPTTGVLTPKTPATIATGSGPRDLAMTPDGRRLFAALNGADQVAGFDIDAGTGLLTAQSPAVTATGDAPLTPAVSPDGRRLYVTNATDDTVSRYDLDAVTGVPAFAATTSSGGTGPWGVTISPNQSPVPAFLPTTASTGTAVTFVASGSSDPDGTIATYAWNFGDGNTASTGSTTAANTYATAGTYPVELTLTDNEGCSTALIFTGATAMCTPNASNPLTQNVVVSVSTPTITAGPADGAGSNTTSPSFSFTAPAGHTFECRFAGGAWAVCTSPDGYTGLTEGVAYTFEVRAVDAGSNRSTPVTRTFTVDLTPPTAPAIIAGPAEGSASGADSASFGFAGATDPGGTGIAGHECRVDGGAWAACTTPTDVTSLADGSHTFEVRAIDNAGNASTAVTRTWTVDTTAPTAPSITSGPTDGTITAATTASFAFSGATDPGGTGIAGHECRLDGGAWAACTSPRALVSVADGAHTFDVRAIDNGGNVSTAVTRTWTVDATPPSAPAITSGPADGSTIIVTATSFSFDATDPGGSGIASYECSLDSAAWAACTSPTGWVGMTEATHTFAVRAIDAAGNAGAATTVTWTIDTTIPTAPVVTDGPAEGGIVATTSVTFAFGGSTDPRGPIAGYECRADGLLWTLCAGTETLLLLSEGAHTFEVRAIDADGNRGVATLRTWTVDSVAPAPDGFTSGPEPADLVAERTASLGFSGATDPAGTGVTGRECRLDGGAWLPCTSPYAVSELQDGEHTVEVRAIDAAGNASTATARTWTVLATPPETEAQDGPPDYVAGPDVVWSFTTDQSAASFECAVDDADWKPCTSPYAVRLAEGVHTILVRAISRTGVPDPRPLSRSVVVDLTTPQTRILREPEPLSADPNTEIVLGSSEPGSTYECRGEDGAWSTCAAVVRRALSPGRHVLHARAVDRAGNADPQPTTARWNVLPVERPVLGDRATETGERVLRCDLPAPLGANGVSYRWYRDRTLIAVDAPATRLMTPEDDATRLRCEATVTFPSGASRAVRSSDVLVLGDARLRRLAFPKRLTAGQRVPTARFSVSRDTLVLVRLWCRDGARRCPRPVGEVDQTATALAASARLVKYRRLLAVAPQGRAAVELDDILSGDLPAGEYKLTVRLARRTATGRHVTSNFLAASFTVSEP